MQVSTNTFNEGLVMDFAPEITKNNCLTNALNSTLVTMNGNELQLQNDMGNGKVYKAELPAGYMPLGTTELGGIIYIVSYNPFTNKCQVGSFPSPQQVYSTEDIPLQWKEYIISPFDSNKILISNDILNPGDKFYFIIDTDLSFWLYNKNDTEHTIWNFINPRIALLTSDNKLLPLDIPVNKALYYKENLSTVSTMEQASEQSYSIITGKTAGIPILILDKVNFSYSSNIQYYIDGNKKFILRLNNLFSSSDIFFPCGININLSLFSKDNSTDAPSAEIFCIFNPQDIYKIYGNTYNILIENILNLNECTNKTKYLQYWKDLVPITEVKTESGTEKKYEWPSNTPKDLIDLYLKFIDKKATEVSSGNNETSDIELLNEQLFNIINTNKKDNYILNIVITPMSYNLTLPLTNQRKLLYNNMPMQSIDIDLATVGSGQLFLTKFEYQYLENNVTISYNIQYASREGETFKQGNVILWGISNNQPTELNSQEFSILENENQIVFNNLVDNCLYLVQFKVITTIQKSEESEESKEEFETSVFAWLMTNNIKLVYNTSEYELPVDIDLDLATEKIGTTTITNSTFSVYSENKDTLDNQKITQTQSANIKIGYNATFTAEFKDNQVPIVITQCKAQLNNEDLNFQQFSNNTYTTTQTVTKEVTFEVSKKISGGDTSTVNILCPVDFIYKLSSNVSILRFHSKENIMDEKDKFWELDGHSINDSITVTDTNTYKDNALQNYDYTNIRIAKFDGDFGNYTTDTEQYPVFFNNDKYYMIIPGVDRKLNFVNILGNSDTRESFEEVSNVVKSILSTLYVYKKNYNLKLYKISELSCNSTIKPEDIKLNFNNGFKAELKVNNMALSNVLSLYESTFKEINLPALSVYCKLKDAQLDRQINLAGLFNYESITLVEGNTLFKNNQDDSINPISIEFNSNSMYYKNEDVPIPQLVKVNNSIKLKGSNYYLKDTRFSVYDTQGENISPICFANGSETLPLQTNNNSNQILLNVDYNGHKDAICSLIQ